MEPRAAARDRGGMSRLTLLLLLLSGCEGVLAPVAPDGRVLRDDAGPLTDAEPPPPPTEPVDCSPGFAVPIEVAEPVNAERRQAPVSGGVPFARGELFEDDLDLLTLVDASGGRVASFQRPVALGRWDDGSVKWLLLDFSADVPAGGARAFTLCFAETRPASDGVVVTEEADAFVIDTGAMRAVLPKDRFALLSEVSVDLDGDGAYADDERVVREASEMFIDLDDAMPGPRDEGALEHPRDAGPGVEGGSWMRASAAATATRHLASAGDYEVSVFRAGRAHTVFRLGGWHRDPASGRDFGRYTIYLHFYAGLSHVRVSHTWIMTGDPERDFVRRMGIEVPFAASVDRWAVGGPFEVEGEPVRLVDGEPPYVPRVPGPSAIHAGALGAGGAVDVTAIGPMPYHHMASLERDTRVPYAVRLDGERVQEGFAAAGWLDVSDGRVGVAAAVADFWRVHPKQVAWRDGAMTVYLWPDEGGQTLDLRRRYPEARGAAGEWGRAARREFDPVGSAVGLAVTTDVMLQFHAGDHEAARVDAVARGFSDPLRPAASPEHNMASGVLGPIPPRDESSFARTERYLDLTMAWPLRSAEEWGWHGWLDHGDHLIEYETMSWELDVDPNWGTYSNWGYAGWMQEAYRLGPALFVQYLRTGRYRDFRQGDVWLRHHRDVDCVHWDAPDNGPRPGDNRGSPRLGAGHRHDQQHWGGYLAGYGIPTIATAHHYFLTGDGRDLEAMRAYSEWILEDARIENHGRYSVLYMGEALDDPTLIERAWAADVSPGVGFGRIVYDSGMGLMLHDVQTGGAPEVRARLRRWASEEDEAFAYLRAYLEASEGTGEHVEAIARDFATLFPDEDVRTRYFGWAPRAPTGFRDAFSPDIMPDGPFGWPIRSIEHLIFDAGRGLGNNPSRQVFVAQLPWLMAVTPGDP